MVTLTVQRIEDGWFWVVCDGESCGPLSNDEALAQAASFILTGKPYFPMNKQLPARNESTVGVKSEGHAQF